MLDEVLGTELAEAGVVVELSRVEVEEHVVQLVLGDVEGMNATRVTRHRGKGVVGRGAESPRGILHKVGGLIRRSFRNKLHVIITCHVNHLHRVAPQAN